MNPLAALLRALDPTSLARALDDLHALARGAREIPAVEARLTERFDALDRRADGVERQLAAALELGERILGLGERIAELGERVEARGGDLVAAADRADVLAQSVVGSAERLEALGREVLAQGEVIERRAAEVAAAGTDVATAIPTLRRAVELTTPLEGAVERLGRFVDRLPGGGERRH